MARGKWILLLVLPTPARAALGDFLEGLQLYQCLVFVICVPLVLIIVFHVLDSMGSLRLSSVAGLHHNVHVYLDIKVGEARPRRVEIELFSEHFPKTAENFRALCTGEKGMGQSGKKLHFKGSSFHRIVPGFMGQGGDFTNGDGTGGESIYGRRFDDEWTNGYLSHAAPGLLSMANVGENSNSSQFFFTFGPALHLNRKNVVFGQVTHGVSVIECMEEVGSMSGTPTEEVLIMDCGELKSKAT